MIAFGFASCQLFRNRQRKRHSAEAVVEERDASLQPKGHGQLVNSHQLVGEQRLFQLEHLRAQRKTTWLEVGVELVRDVAQQFTIEEFRRDHAFQVAQSRHQATDREI